MGEDRVVVISGAGGGIGTELVKRFVDDGAFVVATDISEPLLAQLESAVNRPDKMRTFLCDVSLEEDCMRLAQFAGATCGRIDVLVNNAGYFPTCAFEQMSYATWRSVIAINLDSVFLMIQSCLPLMKATGKGRIVNIGSGSFFKGTRGQSHYVAAKAGVIGLSRSLAWELAPYGINVNIVTPGLTVTPTALKTFAPEALAARRAQRPLARDQYANDVIGAVVFLAGPDSAFMTGQILNVDGGTIMH